MFSIQIKEITPDRFSDIIEVIAETWEPTYRPILDPEQISFMQGAIYTPESLQQQREAGQHFFGLYQNDVIAGFASVSALEKDTYKLNKIYVKPDFQGKGYGQLLLGHLEQEVLKLNGKSLLLNVNRYNKARKFYERQGFTVVKEEDVPIGPYYMNDYVMVKKLT